MFIVSSLKVFVIFYMSDIAYSYLQTRDYIVTKGNTSTENTYTILASMSRIKCAATCSSLPWCRGANFHTATRECHLQNRTTTMTKYNPGWTFLTWCLPLKPAPQNGRPYLHFQIDNIYKWIYLNQVIIMIEITIILYLGQS